MKHSKSALLKSLLKNFHRASFIEKHPHVDADALIQLENADQHTRRKFLTDVSKTFAAISIGSLLPLSSCNSTNDTEPKVVAPKQTNESVKIAIIGAGIAGLNCAYQLKKQGVTAQIFEGDKRTGGRMLTKENIFGQGITTEFGGEFIDSNHEDMLQLAKEFNLELIDTLSDITDNKLIKDAYFFNNRHYTEKEIIKAFQKVTKKIEADLESCGENYDTPSCEKLDNTSLEEYVRSLKCEKWLQDLLISAYTAEYGLDAGEQSALNLVDMISTDTSDGFAIFGDSDERYKIKGGNAKITDALANALKDQLHTEHKLLAVKNAGNKYTLVFENSNKEVTADFVVMCIPFTILRDIDFQITDISEEKKTCIQELGYGQNNKLILGFNNRIWREGSNKYAGYLMHPDIQNGWDSSQMQNNNSGAGSYTIFLGGTPSLELAKAQQTEDRVSGEIVQKYLLKLNTAFKGVDSQFSSHKVALWSNNPFVKASYACYKVGQWTSISGKEIEPIGNISFAGEHCSNDFQGFMNGGAETGRRAAEELIKQIK